MSISRIRPPIRHAPVEPVKAEKAEPAPRRAAEHPSRSSFESPQPPRRAVEPGDGFSSESKPSAAPFSSVTVNGQAMSFSDAGSMSRYWQATFNKPNLTEAEQTASAAFLRSYYDGLKASAAAQAQANAVDPSSMSLKVLPTSPALVKDAERLLANYGNLAVKTPNGTAQIPNEVYDAANTGTLRSVLMGDGTAKLPPRQPWDGKSPITMDMVTPEMLIQPYTSELLQHMADPAAFMNMRSQLRLAPSNAQVISVYTGQSVGGQNPAQLSQLDDAQAIQSWMAGGGLNGGVSNPELGGMFYVQWNDETRRHHQVGNENVGLILQQLASSSADQVLARLKLEFSNG